MAEADSCSISAVTPEIRHVGVRLGPPKSDSSNSLASAALPIMGEQQRNPVQGAPADIPIPTGMSVPIMSVKED